MPRVQHQRFDVWMKKIHGLKHTNNCSPRTHFSKVRRVMFCDAVTRFRTLGNRVFKIPSTTLFTLVSSALVIIPIHAAPMRAQLTDDLNVSALLHANIGTCLLNH